MLPRRASTPLKILASRYWSRMAPANFRPQPSNEDIDALRQATSLIKEAEESTGSTAANYLIQAAKLLLAESEFERAGELMERIDRPAALPPPLKISCKLVQADLAISQNDRAT